MFSFSSSNARKVSYHMRFFTVTIPYLTLLSILSLVGIVGSCNPYFSLQTAAPENDINMKPYKITSISFKIQIYSVLLVNKIVHLSNLYPYANNISS